MGTHATPADALDGWRRSPLEVAAPRHLVAGSEALLDHLASAPTPALRWYRPTSTAIVLGRGQHRLAAALSVGVEVLRRASGGGAVLLSPDVLSLDVALPAGHPWLPDGDVTTVFAEVGTCWAEALAALGVPDPAVHEGPSTTPRATDERSSLVGSVCFASLARGEVTVAGRKLVGLSQRRRRHGALVQCGLLWRWRPQALLAALGSDRDDAEVGGAAIGLAELLVPPPDESAVIAAVSEALVAGARASSRAGDAGAGSRRPSPR